MPCMQQHSESSKLSSLLCSGRFRLPALIHQDFTQCTIDFILFCLFLIPYSKLCQFCRLLSASLGCYKIIVVSVMVDQKIILFLWNMDIGSWIQTTKLKLCDTVDSNIYDTCREGINVCKYEIMNNKAVKSMASVH